MTRTEKIAAIRALPGELREAVAGMTEEQLTTPYREAGWSSKQIVHHIADSHMNAFIRMKLILAEDRPTLKPYDQDTWARLPDGNVDIASSLAIIDGLHSRMGALLENVQNADWSRTGSHPENGDMSLDRILDIYANHGRHHISQIAGLRERMGW